MTGSSFRICGLTRRHARALAGMFAGLLFTSHVLAAGGWCAVKLAAAEPMVASAAVVDEPCHDQSLDASRVAESSGNDAAPHCAAEDPQARTADLPGFSSPAIACSAVLQFAPPFVVDRHDTASAEPLLRPLYVRFNRLLL